MLPHNQAARNVLNPDSFVEQQPEQFPPAANEALEQLQAQIERCMLRHRYVLNRRLRGICAAIESGKPFADQLAQLTQDISDSSGWRQRREDSRPTPRYPAELPVVEKREEIAKAIGEHQVVVICGETGSGKTTQLPKICLELGRGVAGMIGHTQPRRIAARSVAARLAQELESPLGHAVGYKVRFSDKLSNDTYIKLMTDGILLAETQSDRFLNQYDTIIIDEAHERSLNIDFLLGYLKQLLPKRSDLKVIITSATIDPERFSKHFNDAPIVMVSGRTYPVEVRYRPLRSEDPDEQEVEQHDAILSAVDELWREGPGDTLIFLSGEREIRETAESLRKHHPVGTEIIPLYARLSAEEQMRVFQPHDRRRIVLATNVAETSLTVPGIKYVIDPGYARISRYSSRTRIQRLPIEAISQASADQRKGRCGRVSEGICIRLFSEADFISRSRYTDPEILRTNLASVILQMKAFGLGRIEDFPFIDPPDYRQVRDGYQTLFEIGAIDPRNELTEIGHVLARLPIDPRIGRMILAAQDENCLDEVLVIAAALSVQDPRERPLDKQQAADEAHARFRESSSDFLTLMNLWKFYQENLHHLSGSKMRKLAHENFLSFVRLREWHDVYRQLREIIGQLGWHIGSEPATHDAIHRALLAGLLSNIGVKGDRNDYSGLNNKKFHIFPGSALFHRKPHWIMSAEIVETTKLYARTVANIKPEWIERAGAHLVKRSYSDPHWQKRGARVVAYEKVTLHGLAVVPKRTVHFGPIDPKTSREIFIHSALVAGDYDTDAPYFRNNRSLVREVELLEAKTRRNDILADAQTQFAFYDARIPAHVNNGFNFEKWRRHAEHDNRKLLFMSREDLMARAAGEVSETQFPPFLEIKEASHVHAGLRLPLSYRFDPGHPLDGVTVTVRLNALNQIPKHLLDWLVPGLVEEKALDLIRTLPKPARVNLIPAPDFARRAAAAMSSGDGGFLESLAHQLGKLSGIPISADTFAPQELADYLKMNIRVIDEAGRQLAIGRDIDKIRHDLRDKIQQSFQQLPPSPFNRDDVRAWDFGDLPDHVELKQNGLTLQATPAVVDQGNSVALRLVDSPETARQTSRNGVRRLFMLEYEKELKFHVDHLPGLQAMSLHYATLGSAQQLKAQITAAISDRLIQDDAADVRTRMDFELKLESAWNRLGPVSDEIASLTRQILESYQSLSLRLTQTFAPLLAPSINQLRQQLRDLVPADFITATPRQWLPHLPRFLKAIETRLNKLLNAGLSRDLENSSQLAPLISAYEHLKRSRPSAEVTQLRWLIEELRVSLFAQELKTSAPVSVARLERFIAQLDPK